MANDDETPEEAAYAKASQELIDLQKTGVPGLNHRAGAAAGGDPALAKAYAAKQADVAAKAQAAVGARLDAGLARVYSQAVKNGRQR